MKRVCMYLFIHILMCVIRQKITCKNKFSQYQNQEISQNYLIL